MKNTYFGIAIIALIAIVLVAAFMAISRPGEMTLGEARAIAAGTESECAKKGSVGEKGEYNANSRTWWVDFTPHPQFAQAGCNPACVVDEVTKQAQINWRCTGLIPPATFDDLLHVDTPLPDAEVSSPLTVAGRARGSWYFEASFPVMLYDGHGTLLAQTPAQAQGDWMTSEYVPFNATLTFTADTATGTLVIQNDNPSGMTENQKELRIPVRFANAFSSEGNVTRNNPGQTPDTWYLIYDRPGSPASSVALDFSTLRTPPELSQGQRVRVTGTVRDGAVVVQSIVSVPSGSTPIKLYYYNPALDQGPGGIECSPRGLVAVNRVIPKTQTPLKDAVVLLLKGELTAEERAQGVTTEFPLPGVALRSAAITNGVATLSFDDPQNKTGGGSCRVAILWAQIEATAMQFSTVQTVRFEPEELFQP